MIVVPDDLEPTGAAVRVDGDGGRLHLLDRTPFGDDRDDDARPNDPWPLDRRTPSDGRRGRRSRLGVDRAIGLTPDGGRAPGRRGRPERPRTGAADRAPEAHPRGGDRAVRRSCSSWPASSPSLLGEVRDGLLVLVALFPIVAADVVTEYRGERALEALREASAPTARRPPDGTRRGGRRPPASCPGDIVLLRAGDVVPGRPAPHARGPAGHRPERPDRGIDAGTGHAPSPIRPTRRWSAARTGWRTAGTSVVARSRRGRRRRGRCQRPRSAGSRAASGRAQRRRSPLQAELDRLVRILLVVAIGLIAIVTGLGFARGQDAGANILAGVSAAIAAIPEEPPVLLAVILGLGAYRLLRRGVLVRRLNAEETLGAIDLIVTDKTGTLTRNRLDVASVSGPRRAVDEAALRLESSRRPSAPRMTPGSGSEGTAPGSFTASLVPGGGEGRRRSRARSRRPARGRAGRRTGRPVVADAQPRAPAPGRRGRWRSVPRKRSSTLADPAPAEARGVGRAGRGACGRRRAAGRASLGGPDGERLDDPRADRLRRPDARRDPRGARHAARIAGIEVVVVTGDHPLTAAAIATQAGLDRDRIGGRRGARDAGTTTRLAAGAGRGSRSWRDRRPTRRSGSSGRARRPAGPWRSPVTA